MIEKIYRSRFGIYITAAIITAIVTFILIGREQKVQSKETMMSATLPVLTFETQEGTSFNQLHGYFEKSMEKEVSAESLTPLSSDKRQKIVIHSYGQALEGITYEIREKDSGKLMEKTDVSLSAIKDETAADQTVYEGILNIKNLLDADEEYRLSIALHMTERDDLYFFTTVKNGSSLDLEKKIAFFKTFAEAIYDPNQQDTIKKQLIVKSGTDASNYAISTMNNNVSHVTWGSLSPKPVRDIIPTITAMTEKEAESVLNYPILIPNTGDLFDEIQVREEIGIKTSTRGLLITKYDRRASEKFMAEGAMMSGTRVNLGIQPEDNSRQKSSEDGNITMFMNNGNLWSFRSDTSTFTRVFSFSGRDYDGVREDYPEHDGKILKVEKDGSAYFLIYGYMNRGTHEGYTGISLMHTDGTSGKVEEMMFIPVTQTFARMDEDLQELGFVSKNGVFYLKVGSVLYSIDTKGTDVFKESENLSSGTYVVSTDETQVAFSVNGSATRGTGIRAINLDAGTSKDITAEDGDYVKVLGYINRDLVIGLAHAKDCTEESFRMYEIQIIDENGEMVKQYAQDGVLITDAEVMNRRVRMERILETDGSELSSDQLIGPSEETTKVHSIFVSDETRLKELVLILSAAGQNYADASVKINSSILLRDGNTVNLNGPS